MCISLALLVLEMKSLTEIIPFVLDYLLLHFCANVTCKVKECDVKRIGLRVMKMHVCVKLSMYSVLLFEYHEILPLHFSYQSLVSHHCLMLLNCVLLISVILSFYD